MAESPVADAVARRNPCAERLDRVPWTTKRTYRVADTTVGVRTTSDEFAALIDDAFSSASLQEPASSRYSAVVTGDGGVKGGRAVHTLYRGCRVLMRTGEIEELAAGLIADLASLTFARRTDAVYVDASLADVGGVPALIDPVLASDLQAVRGRAALAGVRLPVSAWSSVDLRTGASTEVAAASAAQAPRRSGGDVAVGTDIQGAMNRTVQAVVLESVMDADARYAISGGVALHRLASLAANLRTLGGPALHVLARVVSGARCLGVPPGPPQRRLNALVAALEAAA